MQIDKVALDKNLSHLPGNLFAGKADVAFLRQLEGELPGVLDRFLDQLFKGGEFDGLRDAMRDGKLR